MTSPTDRQVRVRFDGDHHGLDRAARDGAESVERMSRRVGKSNDTMARSTGHLAREMDQATKRIKALSLAFDQTGDRGLWRELRRERSALRTLTQMSKAMTELGADSVKAGSAATSAFVQIGTKLPSPYLIAGVGLGMAAAAPIIGAGISAAVIGGVGAGGIIGGIAGAARDPRVKASWKAVADEGSAALGDFSGPFITPTLRSLDIFRNELHGLRPELVGLGTDAAKGVEPFARGLAGMAREALPGIRSLMRQVGPTFKALGEELPQFGRAVGDFFDSIADGAPGAIKFFRFILRAGEFLIVTFGRHVEMLSTIFELVSRIPGPLKEMTEGPTKSMKGLGDAGSSAFDSIEDSVNRARSATERLNQRFDDAFGKIKNLDQAQIDFKLGMIDLGETLKDNGRKLDTVSEAGLRNRDALIEQIDRAKDLRDAEIDRGDGTKAASDKANAAYLSQLGQIEKLAVSLGLPKKAVQELLDKYRELAREPVITKTVRFVSDLKGWSPPRQLQGEHVAMRYGGVYYAQTGLLNLGGRAQVFPGGRTLFGFAEPGTGGEGFVARNASRRRSLDIMSVMGQWHKAAVIPHELLGALRPQVIHSGPEVLELTLDLGADIQRVVTVNLREHDRSLKRRVAAGTGRR